MIRIVTTEMADFNRSAAGIADEMQCECDYFWAIAFREIDTEIDALWQEFERPIELIFTDIHEILEDFDLFTQGDFKPVDLEKFVAQQIWIYKCSANSIRTPEFAEHLAGSKSIASFWRGGN